MKKWSQTSLLLFLELTLADLLLEVLGVWTGDLADGIKELAVVGSFVLQTEAKTTVWQVMESWKEHSLGAKDMP